MKCSSAYLYRNALPYTLGCLTGFLISACLFNLLTPSSSVARSSQLSAFINTHSTPVHPSYPLGRGARHFVDIHDDVDHLIPDDLDLHGAAIHSNHSTLKLLACVEHQGPAGAIIVPTRSSPSFAITVLDPKAGHTTSNLLLKYGVDDVHLLHVLAPLFHGECAVRDTSDPTKQPGLIVIQAADIGFISMYAASVGCPVLMLEPREVMRKALNSTLCANPQFSANLLLLSLTLNGATEAEINAGADTHLMRAYVGVDSEGGEYPEYQAESHMDCTQPSVATQCRDIPSTSLAKLLSPTSPVFEHFKQFPALNSTHIFLIQLNGDAASVYALLNAHASLLASYRVYHILLPFRPHLIGLELSKKLLSNMDQWGYEIAEIPYISPDSGFSLFQVLKSYIHAASPFASLASYTRALKYTELDDYAARVFECSDKEGACRVDLLFTLMSGRFTAGIVPHSEGKGKYHKTIEIVQNP